MQHAVAQTPWGHNGTLSNVLKMVAEFAVLTVAIPIGIAEYQINDKLPEEVEEQLPAIDKLLDNVSSIIDKE